MTTSHLDLGQRVSRHYLNPVSVLVKLVSLTVIAIFLVLVVSLERTQWWHTAFMVVLFALFGVVVFWYARRLSLVLLFPRLELYADGLRYTRLGRDRAWRWDEFTALKFWLMGAPNNLALIGNYQLYIDDQFVVAISPDFWRSDRIYQTIWQETAKRLVPRYIERFSQGETILFHHTVTKTGERLGEIQINQSGLTKGAQFIAWEDVTGINAEGEALRLFVRHQGFPQLIEIMNVYNGHVLAMFIEAILSQEARQIKRAAVRRAPSPPPSEPKARARSLRGLQAQKFAVALAVGAGLIVAGLLIPWRYGAADFTFLGIALLIEAALVVWYVLSVWMMHGRTLTITPTGIEFRGRRRMGHWRWDEITALTYCWHGWLFPHIEDYVLSVGQHPVLRVNMYDFPDGDRLMREIQARLYNRLYREAVTQFERGAAVQFGKITLDAEGLRLGRRRFQWAEISDWQVMARDKRLLLVIARRRQIKIRYLGIPNAAVLFAMLRLKLGSEMENPSL